jgi:PIN domain nuclease of toxin-antitoxin system
VAAVLLDTQTLIEAYLPSGRLPAKARKILSDPDTERLLSVVSIVEIGIKSSLGKLQISEAELHKATADLQLTIIPFSPRHAFGLFQLPDRTDMFDRMIVATALAENVPVIGGDREFSKYKGLKVIWR